MRNRRHSFRASCELTATCHVVDRTGVLGAPVEVAIRDLSATGVRLVTQERLWPGQVVYLKIAAASPPLDVAAHATVVWTGERAGEHGWAMAASFEGLDTATRTALTRFVFAEARRRGLGATPAAARAAAPAPADPAPDDAPDAQADAAD